MRYKSIAKEKLLKTVADHKNPYFGSKDYIE